jgi:hypothetical protein
VADGSHGFDAKSARGEIESKQIKFLLDVLVISIITASGYGEVLNTRDEIFEKRFHILPQSVDLLRQQISYDAVVPKIFEFLMHIITNVDSIDSDSRDVLKKCLAAAKNHEYFRKEQVWQKVLTTVLIHSRLVD